MLIKEKIWIRNKGKRTKNVTKLNTYKTGVHVVGEDLRPVCVSGGGVRQIYVLRLNTGKIIPNNVKYNF